MTDVVVIGAGVVGLAAARALAQRGLRVTVLDKESRVGHHASGRNSGVLHAGFYYSADSLKAQTCAEGGRRWKSLLARRGIPVRACGKLVVARTADDHPALDALLQRGLTNGVRVAMIDAAEARRIEPRVRTVERALWSPDTATVDPRAAVEALAADALDAGVTLRLGTQVLGPTERGVDTTAGTVLAPRVLVAAGLHADRLAHAWGLAPELTIVPFRGAYLLGEPAAGPLATCVYPVPEPSMPFLGAHFTLTAAGAVKIGPTALPAAGREHYAGVAGADPSEAAAIAGRWLQLSAQAPFRELVAREVPKLWRRHLVRQAAALIDGVDPRHFVRWGPPGIRAQLFDRRQSRLVDDFTIAAAPGVVHVLNAVSPGFTASLALADTLADRVLA